MIKGTIRAIPSTPAPLIKRSDIRGGGTPGFFWKGAIWGGIIWRNCPDDSRTQNHSIRRYQLYYNNWDKSVQILSDSTRIVRSLFSHTRLTLRLLTAQTRFWEIIPVHQPALHVLFEIGEENLSACKNTFLPVYQINISKSKFWFLQAAGKSSPSTDWRLALLVSYSVFVDPTS